MLFGNQLEWYVKFNCPQTFIFPCTQAITGGLCWQAHWCLKPGSNHFRKQSWHITAHQRQWTCWNITSEKIPFYSDKLQPPILFNVKWFLIHRSSRNFVHNNRDCLCCATRHSDIGVNQALIQHNLTNKGVSIQVKEPGIFPVKSCIIIFCLNKNRAGLWKLSYHFWCQEQFRQLNYYSREMLDKPSVGNIFICSVILLSGESIYLDFNRQLVKL